ncbi:putative oxidoreductase [Xylariaceae sp. FL0255]|nr:putative oxidoreductase [Xylariaceae sp. FL0255]
MSPQIIFGTAVFGMDGTAFQDAESVKNLLSTLQENGISRIDTAARYPPLLSGRSEELLGEAKELSSSFVIDTKVYVDTSKGGSGSLTPEAIRGSTAASLGRLQRPEGVNVLYVHAADPTTPLEAQIKGFAEQMEKKHCNAWGVSNVPPAMLEEILQICEQQSLPKPRYYQGTYNVISRGAETKLFPLLRAHGMKFVAFWVLANGFLTGNLLDGPVAGTRFGDDNPLGKQFQEKYGNVGVLEATRKFDRDTRSIGLSPLEVAIRWIYHHSALTDDEDAILLGASRISQVIENLALIKKGPLPDSVLPLVEEIWEAVKETRGDII